MKAHAWTLVHHENANKPNRILKIKRSTIIQGKRLKREKSDSVRLIRHNSCFKTGYIYFSALAYSS